MCGFGRATPPATRALSCLLYPVIRSGDLKSFVTSDTAEAAKGQRSTFVGLRPRPAFEAKLRALEDSLSGYPAAVSNDPAHSSSFNMSKDRGSLTKDASEG